MDPPDTNVLIQILNSWMIWPLWILVTCSTCTCDCGAWTENLAAEQGIGLGRAVTSVRGRMLLWKIILVKGWGWVVFCLFFFLIIWLGFLFACFSSSPCELVWIGNEMCGTTQLLHSCLFLLRADTYQWVNPLSWCKLNHDVSVFVFFWLFKSVDPPVLF